VSSQSRWSSQERDELRAALNAAEARVSLVAKAMRRPLALGAHPVLIGLLSLEEKLQAAGFPAMSPWWRARFALFYGCAKLQLVLRVGRRGGKSSSLCRIAVLEALYGEHDIPPGDVGVVAIISTKRDEATQRLRTIKAVLGVLHVEHRPIDGGVELVGRPIAFKVFTASIAGVSGPTCIFVICDEVAKWRDADTGANPAREVLASLGPTMATQPNARMVLSSSPLGTMDAHAKAFDEGQTERQMVAHAPSWVANPTLSESHTHVLEPDDGKWKREYAAIPMEGDEESIFSAALLTRATRIGPVDLPPMPGWTYVAAMDPATRGNAWTLVVSSRDESGRMIFAHAQEWRGSSERPLDPESVLLEQASILGRFHVKHVQTDNWAGDALASIARRHGLNLVQTSLTMGRKIELYDAAQTKIADGQVELPPHPQLRADLLGVKRVVTASGMSIRLAQTPDGRHSDFAPPVALLLEQHCPGPRTVETVAQASESRTIAKEEEQFGRKVKRDYWQRGP
jgi:hypothetical protein